MTTYDTVVIAGYGIAGITAADTLRAEGHEGCLIIIGAEASEPYSRPALSKTMMAFEADPAPQFLPPATHGAEVLLGRRATGLDRAQRTITLDDGTVLTYDGLVIATGSAPRRLTDDEREFVVRGAEDAARLRARLQERPRVAVLGGGALGMEIASGAREIGCAVTLVHRGLPMTGHLGPYLARLCCRAAGEWGVDLVDGTVTEVIAPHDAAGSMIARLAGGAEISADIIVTAVGDVPADSWLSDSGLLTGGRLLVDERGRVDEGIVAAGDVAWLPTGGGHQRHPLWTSAIEQAKGAARALLAGDAAEPLQFDPYFWTEQFGLNIRVSGTFPVEGEPEIVAHGQALNPEALLLRWNGRESCSAAAVDYRIPIPRLRKVAKGILPAA